MGGSLHRDDQWPVTNDLRETRDLLRRHIHAVAIIPIVSVLPFSLALQLLYLGRPISDVGKPQSTLLSLLPDLRRRLPIKGITSPVMCDSTAKYTDIFHTSRSRSWVKKSRSQPNVTFLQRYKTPTDRLSDFKLGMGVVIKGDKDWCASGSLKLQCNSIATFSRCLYVSGRCNITFREIMGEKSLF